MTPLLDRWFELSARGSTPARELRGALATFLTMAYILFVNPAILSAAGIPVAGAATATAAAAAVCSLLMGLVANFPIALASGMGLNAVVAFQLAGATGSWQAAMGLVVLDGIVVLALVGLGVREAVMHAIPRDLRRAIGVGIGLFIAFIGLVNARLVVVPGGTLAGLGADPRALLPPVTFGSLGAREPLIALVGLLVTAVLMVRRTTGALLIGIFAGTVAALVSGLTQLPRGGWLAAPDFGTFGAFELPPLSLAMLPLLLSLVMVDFFDTVGSVTAIAEEGKLYDERGRIPKLRRILAVDAASATIGGIFGASTVTSYVESAAGVAEGARTGLHSVGVAVLFAAALFAAPLLSIVPPAATAPALVVVGYLMCEQITKIEFGAAAVGIPAFVVLATIPFTWSISHGIGYGFITYVVIALLSGKGKDVHPLMIGTAVVFALFFLLE